jgi:hypothetical protein
MAQGPAPMKSMAERYRRPDWVRRLNAMAGSVGGDPRRLVPIDAADLFAQAQEIVGHTPRGDFGDPQWQSRFEQLAAAADASTMHVVGRLMTRQEILRALATRLRLAAAWDANPALAKEKVETPIIVTGPARSGTTILFELLALDPAFRAPAAWEAIHPLPARAPGDPGDRLAVTECEQELWEDVQPEFAAIHELRSDLPVECVTLTMPCFCGPHWTMVGVNGFAMDMGEMYAFHKRILQVLQHGVPNRAWLLKTPGHLATIEMVFATYPDAWLVQTHRDPAKTMPSTVSTTAMVQWLRTDAVDLAPLAAAIDGFFAFALNRTVELRKSGAVPDRFVDVHFDRVLANPVETLREAYARMGRDFGTEHAERVLAYLRAKPRGKHGVHKYEPEDWGFEARSLRQRLAPYIDHFGVSLES